MLPIFATAAASVAGDIISNIADRIAQGTAKAAPAAQPEVPFSALLEKAAGPTPLELARRAQALGQQLSRSAEIAGAINAAGTAGPLTLQIDASGDTALRLPDGGLQPIRLSEELRSVARQLHALRQPAAGSPTAPARPVLVTLA